MRIAREAVYILKILNQAGYDGYIVGGAVRDLLLLKNETAELTSKTDYDFTTNATPEQILTLFPDSFYENEFGTVAIAHEELISQAGFTDTVFAPILDEESKRITEKTIDLTQATKVHTSLQTRKVRIESDAVMPTEVLPNYEITTYRSQELYSNHRKPDKLEWGQTISEDLIRRDFTINALALKVTTFPELKSPVLELGEEDIELIDEHHGIEDLRQGIIRTVGDANTRFEEDALRMMRAIRLSVQLNFAIEDSTYRALCDQVALMQHISWERIRDEFLKMLESDYPAEAIEMLDGSGLLDFILPELQDGKGVKQGGHHVTDVWTHSLDALRTCPSVDPIVRLATLLHDIAKPQTYLQQKGTITFYNHELIGARVAKRIANRLRLSKQAQERVFTLVRYHMFYYQPHNTDASIRRFMRKVGLENLNDILDLREGDRLGSGARKTSWRLEEMKQRMIEQLHQPFSITDLALDGTEIMLQCSLKPGRIIGEVLLYLFEKVLDDPELNTQETLLELTKEYLAAVSKKS